MKNILLIAPPAAGKGTQADLIVSKYHIPHISTGDLLREISREDSEMGNYVRETISSGNLVKDEITYKLIENKIKQETCRNGFVMDGFPRNIDQAIQYDKILKKMNYDIGCVILIDIDKEILEKRITGRRICQECNSIYNINFDTQKPQVESVCDNCGGHLYQRDDDNISSFNTRYELYLEKTKPIIDHYSSLGVLHRVNGNDSIESIFNDIDKIITGDEN